MVGGRFGTLATTSNVGVDVGTLWSRLDRPAQVAIGTGAVLALATIPLNAFITLVIGLAACAVLGWVYPDESTKVGILVAAPVLSLGFLVALIRGFAAFVLMVLIACSLLLPVAISRFGAQARRGK